MADQKKFFVFYFFLTYASWVVGEMLFSDGLSTT